MYMIHFGGISVVWATSMIYERSIPALPKMDQSEDVGKTTRISPVYIVDIIYVIGDIIGDDSSGSLGMPGGTLVKNVVLPFLFSWHMYIQYYIDDLNTTPGYSTDMIISQNLQNQIEQPGIRSFHDHIVFW